MKRVHEACASEVASPCLVDDVVWLIQNATIGECADPLSDRPAILAEISIALVSKQWYRIARARWAKVLAALAARKPGLRMYKFWPRAGLGHVQPELPLPNLAGLLESLLTADCEAVKQKMVDAGIPLTRSSAQHDALYRFFANMLDRFEALPEQSADQLKDEFGKPCCALFLYPDTYELLGALWSSTRPSTDTLVADSERVLAMAKVCEETTRSRRFYCSDYKRRALLALWVTWWLTLHGRGEQATDYVLRIQPDYDTAWSCLASFAPDMIHPAYAIYDVLTALARAKSRAGPIFYDLVQAMLPMRPEAKSNIAMIERVYSFAVRSGEPWSPVMKKLLPFPPCTTTTARAPSVLSLLKRYGDDDVFCAHVAQSIASILRGNYYSSYANTDVCLELLRNKERYFQRGDDVKYILQLAPEAIFEGHLDRLVLRDGYTRQELWRKLLCLSTCVEGFGLSHSDMYKRCRLFIKWVGHAQATGYFLEITAKAGTLHGLLFVVSVLAGVPLGVIDTIEKLLAVLVDQLFESEWLCDLNTQQRRVLVTDIVNANAVPAPRFLTFTCGATCTCWQSTACPLALASEMPRRFIQEAIVAKTKPFLDAIVSRCNTDTEKT